MEYTLEKLIYIVKIKNMGYAKMQFQQNNINSDYKKRHEITLCVLITETVRSETAVSLTTPYLWVAA